MVELAVQVVVVLIMLEAVQELLDKEVMAEQETLFIPFSPMEAVVVVQAEQPLVWATME
jgi:hypothetical protein